MADEPGGSTGVLCRAAQKCRFAEESLTNFSQDDAAHSSLNEHRLLGNIKNVAKTTRKGHLVDAITKIPPKGGGQGFLPMYR
ncbi:peptidyl-prolyl cis-trans isomerase FKBP3-like [Stigmatopora argus]